MTLLPERLPGRLRLVPCAGVRRPTHVVERNLLFYSRSPYLVLSGALEPILFLLQAHFGLRELVDRLEAPDGGLITYTAFVAPALLATSAASGVMYDTTYNFFDKLRHAKLFDGMLATPLAVGDISLGELASALLRGLVQAAIFVLVMLPLGLVRSWWAILVLPAVLLVEWAFAGLGLAATTYVRSWRDFDWQQLVWLPMFLLSASFFPLSVYPDWLQWIVRVTPLYQGVALLRMLVLGGVDWVAAVHAGYLALLGWLMLRHATRRMARLLLH